MRRSRKSLPFAGAVCPDSARQRLPVLWPAPPVWCAHRQVSAHRIACGDLVLDTAQLTLTGPSSTVTLSRRECDLLAAFCRAPGLLRARAVLLGSVWGSAAEIEDCSLDSYIRFIRRRLTAVGSRAVLRTVRGAGYRFLPDGEENAHA